MGYYYCVSSALELLASKVEEQGGRQLTERGNMPAVPAVQEVKPHSRTHDISPPSWAWFVLLVLANELHVQPPRPARPARLAASQGCGPVPERETC